MRNTSMKACGSIKFKFQKSSRNDVNSFLAADCHTTINNNNNNNREWGKKRRDKTRVTEEIAFDKDLILNPSFFFLHHFIFLSLSSSSLAQWAFQLERTTLRHNLARSEIIELEFQWMSHRKKKSFLRLRNYYVFLDSEN